MKNLEKILKNTEFSWIKKLLRSFPQAEIFLVGGAVRDLLLGRTTYDYDFVVRNVAPEQLEKFLAEEGRVDLVGGAFGVFKFLPKNKKIKEPFDIALPRTEESWGTGKYKDFDVQSNFKLSIEEDLSRRDFTVNAMALKLTTHNSQLTTEKLIDSFEGEKDLGEKIIRTVGKPEERFAEDYTRMLRAVRLACQLGFLIEKNTWEAIKKNAAGLSKISAERIRDEFTKIIMSAKAEEGLNLLYKLNLLKIFIPELTAGVGLTQNRSHIYTVFEHLTKSLGFAAERNYDLEIRLAALLHDIAKPQTKRGLGKTSTFFNHDLVGAKIAKKILYRLRYSNELTEKISHLVRHHMFYYSLGEVTDAGVRRLLARVGKDNVNDLIRLRICDRLGMGRPKAKPWKLQVLERKIQEVQMDAITTSMLKIDGNDLMKIFKMPPGPRIGFLLKALLGEVLEDKKKNTKKYLEQRAGELNKLPGEDLKKLEPNLGEYEKKNKEAFFKKYEEVE
ncbi:MAG: HD domain-containing protein [Patescibacteria group bacterium]|nr:HD domain-containing protein [Patescibacteria group bacterium]MDD5490997.1 HD domain-containing protein [Patescibacteria group bacterium]